MSQEVTIIQAILIGMFYWFETNRYGHSFTASILMSCMPAALWAGIVLGNVPEAMITGGIVQLMYLGTIGPAGNIPQDPALAALVSTVIALTTTGMSTEAVVTIALPIGLLGAQISNLIRAINVVWVHMADKYAQKGNTKGIMLSGLLFPSIVRFPITVIPVALGVYYGPTYIQGILNAIPDWLMHGLTVVGQMMPAVGFAIVVQVIGRKYLLPYFVGAFFLVQYTNMDIIPLAIFGCIIAYLHILFTNKKDQDIQEQEDYNEENSEDNANQRLLKKSDITKSYWLWWFGMEVSNSFERLQGLSFCVTLIPVLKKMYKKGNDLNQALERHLQFFNTENTWGAAVPGLTIALEEQKALGKEMPDEAINGIKTGLMGPFAGIGDTINWATLLPILLGFFVPLARSGNWIAGVAPILIYTAITCAIGYNLFHFGYKAGINSATRLLQSGRINQLILGASILGLLMMGGLAATYVEVSTPLEIASGNQVYKIQEILDQILPGLLPFLTVTGIFLFLEKIKQNYTYAVLIVIVLGLVLGGVGIL